MFAICDYCYHFLWSELNFLYELCLLFYAFRFSFSLRHFIFHFVCYTFCSASRILSSVWCATLSVQHPEYCLLFDVLHFLFSIRNIVFCLMCYTFCSASRILSSVWCATFSVQSTVVRCVFCFLCYTFNWLYSILSVFCATFTKRRQNSLWMQSSTTIYLF